MVGSRFRRRYKTSCAAFLSSSLITGQVQANEDYYDEQRNRVHFIECAQWQNARFS